jgi:hypothetical protein
VYGIDIDKDCVDSAKFILDSQINNFNLSNKNIVEFKELNILN